MASAKISKHEKLDSRTIGQHRALGEKGDALQGANSSEALGKWIAKVVEIISQKLLDSVEYRLLKLHLASNRPSVCVPTSATSAWLLATDILGTSEDSNQIPVEAICEIDINADPQRLFTDSVLRTTISTLLSHEEHRGLWNWSTLRTAITGHFGLARLLLPAYASLVEHIDTHCPVWCTEVVLRQGIKSFSEKWDWASCLRELDADSAPPDSAIGVLASRTGDRVFFGPIIRRETKRLAPYTEIVTLVCILPQSSPSRLPSVPQLASWFDPTYLSRGPSSAGNVNLGAARQYPHTMCLREQT
ncbi:hypothetical protein BOTBODRAFT_174345 [Botryobasidium botryosum FD-172 SS1]|uniref:Uncharacterized protein n=1 Tax=Botryobasidium botryosum (strain FD-172 SS1) TaxID=930990 RepID=A0A067MGC2_BOTB1|nr:hypothetical protein BOTBODRAFT_174345 [Botryobasidium botryosum FD-172 SS1]